jgi:hypothetical protein
MQKTAEHDSKERRNTTEKSKLPRKRNTTYPLVI